MTQAEDLAAALSGPDLARAREDAVAPMDRWADALAAGTKGVDPAAAFMARHSHFLERASP